MHRLDCTLLTEVWERLLERSGKTRQSVDLIVNKALSDYFDIAHHKAYQVSTSTALVEGIHQGAVRVGTLREHGDLGLGTFADLDGEMVVVDGRFFQVRSDGSVREVNDDVLSPFATVTTFVPELVVKLDRCENLAALTSRFDGLRNSDNGLFALRADGKFECVVARARCRSKAGMPLIRAAEVQSEFEFRNVSGTLVGFWTPEYAKSLNVPGYHLHFISEDRICGGHLVECRGSNLRLQVQREDEFQIALPETEDFLKADLRRNASANFEAENQRK